MKFSVVPILVLIVVLTACVPDAAPQSVPSPMPILPTVTSIPTAMLAPTQPVVAAISTETTSLVEPVDPKPRGLVPQPPAASLQVDNQSQEAGIGTYCWKSQPKSTGPTGLCADMIGIPTAADPLIVHSPVQLQFRIPVEGQPAEVVLNVISASTTKEKKDPNSDQRWWDFAEGQVHRLDPSSSPSLKLQLEPGLYVLDLFSRWDDGNDVSYGFLLSVE